MPEVIKYNISGIPLWVETGEIVQTFRIIQTVGTAEIFMPDLAETGLELVFICGAALARNNALLFPSARKKGAFP